MKLDLLAFFLLVWLPQCFADEFLNLKKFIELAVNPNLTMAGSAVYQNSTIHADGVAYFGTQKRRKNLVQQDPDTEDLYKAIGVSQQQVKLLLIPIHKFVLRCLDSYYIFRKIDLQKLYFCAYDLKQVITWLDQNYLQGITTIIIGTNNKIRGNRIYVKTDSTEIVGSGIFSFNSNYADKKIVGKNIVRVGSYDINLNKIEEVKDNIQKAIKVL